MDWLQQHLSIVIGAAVLVLAAYAIYRLVVPRKKVIAEEYKLNVQCRKCRWQGVVTRYNQVCRKCNSRELDVM